MIMENFKKSLLLITLLGSNVLFVNNSDAGSARAIILARQEAEQAIIRQQQEAERQQQEAERQQQLLIHRAEKRAGIENMVDLKITNALNPILARMDVFENNMGEQLANINTRLNVLTKRLAGVDKRLAGVDKRLAGVDKRLYGVDERLKGLTIKANNLNNRVNNLEKINEDEKRLLTIVGVVAGAGAVTYSGYRLIRFIKNK